MPGLWELDKRGTDLINEMCIHIKGDMDWRHVLLPQYCIGYLSTVDTELSFSVPFQHRLYSTKFFQCHSDVGCIIILSPSSGVSVLAAMVRVSPVAFQCGTVSTKSFQWCSSVGYNRKRFSGDIPVWDSFYYVLPVVFQCTLQVFTGVTRWYPSVHWGNQCIPVVFQCVHWTSQCTPA